VTTEFGDWPEWLHDGRRIFYMSSKGKYGGVFSILDIETGEHHEVLSSEILSIAPDAINQWPAISPDNRNLYVERIHRESDIWMLTLDQQP
ncbi:MAG: hypothetical protein WBG67_03410, partial [Thermoanaerobaculia bacterium]